MSEGELSAGPAAPPPRRIAKRTKPRRRLIDEMPGKNLLLAATATASP
jgi:hypothetical protein